MKALLPTQEQMYIIAGSCWKCDANMNVAVIKGNTNDRNGFCGPEAFSENEKKIAEEHGVIIREHRSHTREESYLANTCPHCNTFVGQHYLFTNYFISATYGDYEYKVVDLE